MQTLLEWLFATAGTLIFALAFIWLVEGFIGWWWGGMTWFDIKRAVYWGVLALLFGLMLMAKAANATGHENDPMHAWFETLTDQDGNSCCSGSDGLDVPEVDWRIAGDIYEVFVWGDWVKVPPKAIVKQKNIHGMAVVWPFRTGDEKTTIIRCFMPGSYS